MPSSPAQERIGRYVELKLLGQGGMGAVYRGRDPELDRPVAIKVMLDATPDFVARFRREAQAIARLTHPNIVQVYDFGVDDGGNPYFVMELIDGTPLDQVVRARGRVPPFEAVRLIRQAAEGLAAAHRAGIIHRDVKPSNLIVDGQGTVKLVDFGIARVTTSGQALTGAAALMGTPGYMAPEQAAGKPVDRRADIYALGLTLFELLAGAPPYTAEDPISLVVKNMQEPLPDLRARGFGLPDELVRLVEQMGAKDPGDRLQSCEAVVAALDDLSTRLKTEEMDAAPARWRPEALPPATGAGGGEPSQGSLRSTGAVPPTRIHDAPAAVARAPVSTAPGRKRAPLIVGGLVALLVAAAGGYAWVRTRATPVPVAASHPTPPRPGDATPPVVEKSHPTSPVVARPGEGRTDGPLRVAVLKFKNVGQDPSLRALEEGIGETAVNALAGASKGVEVLERNDIDSDIGEIDRAGDFHFDKLTVAKLGLLRGIEYAVQGGFQRSGKKLRITARLVRVDDGEVVDTLTITRPVGDVFGAQDAVATGLRPKLLALAAREHR